MADDATLKANRQRAAHLILGLKPTVRVRWCPRCGYAFEVPGGKTIFKTDDSGCGDVVSKEGTIREAVEDLRRPQ